MSVTNTASQISFAQPILEQPEISLKLPYDRLRTPQTRFRHAAVPEINIPLSRPESDDVEFVSALVAACVAVLYRYCGQLRIPVSVRSNTVQANLPLRKIEVDVSGQFSLARLQSDIAANLDGGERNNASESMAPILISLTDHECGDEPILSNLDDDANPDIHLRIARDAGSLSIGIDYNESLFDPKTVTRLQGYLKTAINVANEKLSTLIADVPLFSQGENEWFDDRCNGPNVQYPHQPVHVEFETCAALDPNKIAVRCNEQCLTYDELNRRANQVARWLRAQGVGEEKRVVVCLDPSVDVLTAVLGVLKAGATYVPVNPGHPIFRIETILKDTRPSIIITQSHHFDLFETVAAEVICIDRPPADLTEQSSENPDVTISPDQIAYIYYTSGTTGKPKGVMASHSNMINFIRASRDRYRITASDVMPVVASYSFSISIFELMSPLSVGGSLLVLKRDHVLDAGRLAGTLKEVSIFHIGPSLLKNVIKYIKYNYSEYSDFSGVRHASSGGDMVPPELLNDMRDIFPKSEIYVIYGCSEISLMGCTWEARESPVVKTFVGSPFANVRLLVLDDDGNQVPVGAIGDVCFGGAGVIAGYLNRPELTQKLFFERDGMRFYRTGDRGRLDKVGYLELLGRRDFQIQLRGMRIELGEIDYHLRQADGVRDGVVVAKDRKDDDKVLVAYYVSQERNSVDVNALRDHMIRRLPDYMVPIFYVELDALPLNHNLKVDRKELPDYAAPESPIENPPQTETEVALAGIWCELLHLNSVEIGDNFMSLGGDSLLAMQQIMLVEQKLGGRLDGLEILRESLAVLAAIVDQRTGKSPPEGQPEKIIARQIYPLSSFYFGADESLYGLYQSPLAESKSIPVLICPPIGYEYTLSQFFLHLLAENLAVAGIPSLRFDLFGSGDSDGRDNEATFSRWREDLVAAYDELVARTGAETIRVFSFRLNSIMAFHALREKPVDRWVCWDPVTSGRQHYKEMQRMTREKAQKLLVVRNMRVPRKIRGAEELVGVTFSEAAVREMTMMRLESEIIPTGADVVQVLSGDYSRDGKFETPGTYSLDGFPFTQVDDDCNWYASTRVTSAITHKSLLDQMQIDLAGESQ